MKTRVIDPHYGNFHRLTEESFNEALWWEFVNTFKDGAPCDTDDDDAYGIVQNALAFARLA